jgi:hypothetical protein
MKQADITEETIAKFMGLSKGHPDKNETRWANDWFEQVDVSRDKFSSGYRHERLFFTQSWDWLMAVVCKIEELGYQVKIDTHYTQIFFNKQIILIGDTGKLNNTVEAVKDFINSYEKSLVVTK